MIPKAHALVSWTASVVQSLNPFLPLTAKQLFPGFFTFFMLFLNF